MFDEIAEEQGWNQDTRLRILTDWIASQHLDDALAKYARGLADQENAEASDSDELTESLALHVLALSDTELPAPTEPSAMEENIEVVIPKAASVPSVCEGCAVCDPDCEDDH